MGTPTTASTLVLRDQFLGSGRGLAEATGASAFRRQRKCVGWAMGRACCTTRRGGWCRGTTQRSNAHHSRPFRLTSLTHTVGRDTQMVRSGQVFRPAEARARRLLVEAPIGWRARAGGRESPLSAAQRARARPLVVQDAPLEASICGCPRRRPPPIRSEAPRLQQQALACAAHARASSRTHAISRPQALRKRSARAGQGGRPSAGGAGAARRG